MSNFIGTFRHLRPRYDCCCCISSFCTGMMCWCYFCILLYHWRCIGIWHFVLPFFFTCRCIWCSTMKRSFLLLGWVGAVRVFSTIWRCTSIVCHMPCWFWHVPIVGYFFPALDICSHRNCDHSGRNHEEQWLGWWNRVRHPIASFFTFAHS